MLRLAVQSMMVERKVSGDVTRTEDAADVDALFKLSMNQEETLWLYGQDTVRNRTFILRSLDVIEESRKPRCTWWNYACIRRQRALLGK